MPQFPPASTQNHPKLLAVFNSRVFLAAHEIFSSISKGICDQNGYASNYLYTKKIFSLREISIFLWCMSQIPFSDSKSPKTFDSFLEFLIWSNSSLRRIVFALSGVPLFSGTRSMPRPGRHYGWWWWWTWWWCT